MASAHTSSNSSKHPAEASSPSHKTNKALSSGFLSSLLSSSKIRQHEGLRDVNLHIPKSVGTSHYGKASKTRKKRQSGQPQSSECDTLSVRRPWSKATAEQRKAFLTAQMCAATIAPRKIFPNHPANSLWEDFTLLHNYMAPLVHGNPSFLVWHRLFSNAWFYAMYRHCNYQGDILYMDWWTYADRNEVWTSSDIWGDEYYGSNTGSVTDGIFSQGEFWLDLLVLQLTVAVRVNYTTDEDDSHIFYKVNRPICREVRTVSKANIPFVSFMTSDFIREKLLTISDYDKFRDTLESTFHQYLHVSIGCDLLPMTSPNDPVFFAIHSGTDHIHALWQTRDNGANLWKYDGATSDNDATPVKMTDLLVMKDTWSRDFTVEDMLDISSRPNCYSVSCGKKRITFLHFTLYHSTSGQIL